MSASSFGSIENHITWNLRFFSAQQHARQAVLTDAIINNSWQPAITKSLHNCRIIRHAAVTLSDGTDWLLRFRNCVASTCMSSVKLRYLLVGSSDICHVIVNNANGENSDKTVILWKCIKCTGVKVIQDLHRNQCDENDSKRKGRPSRVTLDKWSLDIC